MRTTLKTMPSETGGQGRSTLAAVWEMMDTPFMKVAGHRELPLPKLERCDISIRPLRSDLWAPCPVCQSGVMECECPMTSPRPGTEG